MVLRSATAAGLDGVLLPRRGVPAIDPLVVKASAGVAFRAPVLRAATAEEGCAALRDGGFAVLGLDAAGASLLDAELPRRVALVLGNETDGLSAAVRAAVRRAAGDPDGGRRGVAERGERRRRRGVRAAAPAAAMTAPAPRRGDPVVRHRRAGSRVGAWDSVTS